MAPKIADILSSQSASSLGIGTVTRGDIYLMKMDQSNGIVPKDGDDYRNKFFVVLGFDGNTVYGGVIINSEINKNLASKIKDQQVRILRADYPFLTHDSFVDCVKLKVADISKFASWDFKDKMQEKDLTVVLSKIVNSPAEKRVNLRRFGLI